MKTNTLTKATTSALFLIAWLLVPLTAHCFYNSSTGRWLSRDPIDQRGGLNLYVFVGNDPVARLDINGLISPRHPGQPKDPYDPPNLGRPCPAKCRSCKIEASAFDNGSSSEAFKMKLDFHREGCCRDIEIRWTACYNPTGYGTLESCNDSTECTFHHGTSPGSYGSWEIGIFIRFLSCEGCSWKIGPGVTLAMKCWEKPDHWPWLPFTGGKWICE
jgi:hypothetical protein